MATGVSHYFHPCLKIRAAKPLIVHNIHLMSRFLDTKRPPVCNVLSLMTQLAFHMRGDSNDTLKISTVTTTAGISDDAKSKETLRGWVGNWLYMRLKGQPCEITTFPVLSLFFITVLFITSLPVLNESICSQSQSKENASICFLRLYNL